MILATNFCALKQFVVLPANCTSHLLYNNCIILSQNVYKGSCVVSINVHVCLSPPVLTVSLNYSYMKTVMSQLNALSNINQ